MVDVAQMPLPADFAPAPIVATAEDDPWAEFKAASDPWAEFKQKPSAIEGAAKAFGSGVIKGGAELAGLPGDAQALINAGLSKIMPTPPQEQQPVPGGWYGSVISGLNTLRSDTDLPTSQGIMNAFEKNITPLHEPQNAAERVASTIGEFVPGAVSGSAEASVPARIAKYAVAPGAAVGGINEIPALQNDPYYAKTALDVAGAIAAPGVAQHLISPNAAKIIETPMRQRQVATLKAEGVPVSPGNALNDVGMRDDEAVLNPDLYERQLQAFTAAAGKRIGLPETNLEIGTTGNLPARAEVIGKQFDAIPGRNTFAADPKLYQDLLDIHDYYHRTPGLYDDSVVNAVDGALGRVSSTLKTGGNVPLAPPYQMPGSMYQTLRSDLRDAAMSSADDNKAGALHDITNALDDAFERHLVRTGSPDAAVMPALRQQYRALLTIQDARVRQGNVASQGYITPPNLQSASKKIYGNKAYMDGRTPFTDLAEAGASLLTPRPDSGTPGKLNVENRITALSKAIGSGAGMLAGGAATHATGVPDLGVQLLLMGENTAPALLNPPIRAAKRFLQNNPTNQWRQTNAFLGAPDSQQALVQALLRVNPALQSTSPMRVTVPATASNFAQ